MCFLNCSFSDIANGFSIGGVIFTAIGVIIAILTFVLAKKGIEIVSELKRNQHAAAYGFYSNILTYFKQLEGFIYNGNDMADWLKLLGLNSDEIGKKDQKSTEIVNAEKCAKIAYKFLDFLAQAPNQVPPISENCKQWDVNFDKLREYLFNLANYRLTAYTKWSASKIADTFNDLKIVIESIKKDITDFKEKEFYKELNGPNNKSTDSHK